VTPASPGTWAALETDVPAVVDDERVRSVDVGDLRAVSAKAVVNHDRDVLRRQHGDQVCGAAALETRARIFGEPAVDVGVAVEGRIALPAVSAPRHAVEPHVLVALAEQRLEDPVAVRVGERLVHVHDDPVAQVVDAVRVGVGERAAAEHGSRDIELRL
jgi:hypothetical protein